MISSATVTRWVDSFPNTQRSTVLVVPKSDTNATRYFFGRNSEAWLSDGVHRHVFEKVAAETVPKHVGKPVWFPLEDDWNLLWGLISTRDFVVDEPLKSLVDDGSYLAYEFYRALWEARFLTTENLNLSRAQEVVRAIGRWLRGDALNAADKQHFQAIGLQGNALSTAQSYDLLCMFFALLWQNELVQDYVFSFACLETALSHPHWLHALELFLSSLDRWILMGSCPIGVVLGFDETAENMERLREASPKLAKRIERGLEAC